MRTTTRWGVIGVALLLAQVTACTDDDDAVGVASTTPTIPAPPGTTVLAAATVVSTTVAPTTTIPTVSATRTVVGPATDDAPSATADQLIPAAAGRGFLLIGDRQERPGERWTAAPWESGDAEHWEQLPQAESFGAGSGSHASAGAWVGNELVIGGSTDNDAALEHPAVWSAPDGWTFDGPADPFGGVQGSVVAIVSGPSGPIAGGMADQSGDLGWAPVVAVRSCPRGRTRSCQCPTVRPPRCTAWPPTRAPSSRPARSTSTGSRRQRPGRRPMAGSRSRSRT